MMKLYPLVALTLTLSLERADTFRPIFWSRKHSRKTVAETESAFLLGISSDDASFEDFADDDEEGEEEEEIQPLDDNIINRIPGASSSWSLDNSFELFLNQCTIQSFLFLLKSLRDPQTIIWVEDFTQPTIGSLERPDYMTNQTGGSSHSKLLAYHGLGAINTTLFPTWDSYFQKLLEQPEETFLIESDLPHVPTYEMEIKPASLCSRMTSVRAQIAAEFVKDLEVISTLGGHTLEAYWEGIRRLRDDGEKDEDKTTARVRQSFLFLEFSPGTFDIVPSPLRKGNFDLLLNLATQESIHRMINEGNSFLQGFYMERRDSHFVGAKRYGRADAFLQDLLAEPPRMVQLSEEENELVDPTRLAEELLMVREQVALEWKEVAASVPRAHMDIQRLQLNLLMGKTEEPTVAEEKRTDE